MMIEFIQEHIKLFSVLAIVFTVIMGFIGVYAQILEAKIRGEK